MTNPVALQRHQPGNTNLLQSTKYQLSFRRMPNLVYFLQSVNLPGVSATDVPRNTPFVDLYVPGEKLVYDTLNMTFLLDEDLRGWFEIHDWMKGFTFPENFDQYRKLLKEHKDTGGQYSDAILTINSNANTPVLRVKLIGCFPIQLASIQFDSTQDAMATMTGDATFRFQYHQIDRLV